MKIPNSHHLADPVDFSFMCFRSINEIVMFDLKTKKVSSNVLMITADHYGALKTVQCNLSVLMNLKANLFQLILG